MRTFYWLAVFGTAEVVPVPQPVAQGDDPLSINQVFGQRVTRSGTVDIAEDQPTDEVIKGIVAGCKGSGGVHADALLLGITLLPNVLVPGYGT
jgi:hypothetical protein